MRTLFAAFAALVTAAIVAVPSAGAEPQSRTLCHFGDARIDEASGIAMSARTPHTAFVVNDSGDTNRFFALDTNDCDTTAIITVPGARNIDWEDIATAPDVDGTPSVWLGDIGDNDAQRAEVTVYRVDEPRLDADHVRTAGPQTWRLRYPGGPVDAESLAVAPGGAAYIVTKSVLGASTVYRLPSRPDATRVQTLTTIAAVQLRPVGRSRLGLVGALTATGAAFSADGDRFVLRTYSGAFVWAVRRGGLAAALRVAPTAIALPAQTQGEGITFDADQLLLDSEGTRAPLLAVPAPSVAAAATSPPASAPSSAPSSDGSAASARSSPATSPATSAPSSDGSAASARSSPATSPATSSGGGGGSWLPGIVIGALVVIGAVAWWVLNRRRPAR